MKTFRPALQAFIRAKGIIIVPVILLAGMAGRQVHQNRQQTFKNVCISMLRTIHGAKLQWALEAQKPEGSLAAKADLISYVKGEWLACPKGGTQTLNPTGKMPECSLANSHGHT